jgi:hypothetical protein
MINGITGGRRNNAERENAHSIINMKDSSSPVSTELMNH